MWTYQHANFCVRQIPVLRDNYIYIIEDCHSSIVLVVDPTTAETVIEACDTLKIQPTHILNTHHHWDHTDGNENLVKAYQCRVIGNQADASRVPSISQPIVAGKTCELGSLSIQTIDVPGHTLGHIAFLIDDALFCGDTLFGAGCGRLFEGSHAQMWQSLQHLAALDSHTKVYCAHEYTLANLDFAHSVDSLNKDLEQRILQDTAKRQQQQPTIPSTIALEKKTNPFLRPLNTSFCHHYNLNNKKKVDAFHVFKDLRERKDQW